MDKLTIKNKLYESHKKFISYLNGLTNEEFLDCKSGKWTAGQQLEHIYLGVKPLLEFISLPKFRLISILEQSNKESISYEDLVIKYLLELENGGRATRRFIPNDVSIEKGERLKVELENEIVNLVTELDKLTENELDKYTLPHPLLGKLTIREMMYFTIYHVGHHEKLTKRNLTN